MSNVQQGDNRDVIGATQKFNDWQNEQVASGAKAKLAKDVSEQRRMDCNPPFDKELLDNKPSQDVAQGQPYKARLPKFEQDKGMVDKAKDMMGMGDKNKNK